MKITRRQLRRLIREALSPAEVVASQLRRFAPPEQTEEEQIEALANRIHRGYEVYGGQKTAPLDLKARSLVREYKLTYPDSLIHAGFIMITTPHDPSTMSWVHKDSTDGSNATVGGDNLVTFKDLAARLSQGRIPVEMENHPYDAPPKKKYKDISSEERWKY